MNTGGTGHITNGSTIEKNIATLNGGIFLVARGTVTLNGATVEDNEPNDCVGLTC